MKQHVPIPETYPNGNGHLPPPRSERAFQRSLPGRLGGLEDAVNTHDQKVAEFRARLKAIESRAGDQNLRAQVELVQSVVDLVRLLLGKQRPRRHRALAK